MQLYNLNNPKGITIIWIVVIIMAISAMGTAMLKLYDVSTAGWLDTHASNKSILLADAGYRFVSSEYESQPTDLLKNQLLDQLNGSVFELSTDSAERFALDISSYYFRVETDPAGGTALKLKFVGEAGFDVPAAGYLKLNGDDTVYAYTGRSYDAGTGVYTFTMTSGVSSAVPYTLVRPVIQTSINAVSDGGTLTLGSIGSGLGDVFPEENGMFLLEKTRIRANLPVKTTVPYRYEYRDGDQLVNVRKGPGRSGFTDIDSDSSATVEMAKLVTVKSTGMFGDFSTQANAFHLSLDFETFTSGLLSYWDFENVSGDTVADGYGSSPGTLEGNATITSGGKIGSALNLPGGAGDYLATTFNPLHAIGSNQPFSMVFWAKTDPSILGFQVAVGALESGTPAKRFYMGTYGGKWIWGLGNKNGWDYNSGIDLPEVTGYWQHVAYIFERVGSGQYDILIYINGIKKYSLYEVSGAYYGGSGALANLNISIGAITRSSSIDSNFVGLLDEIAIFNTDLNYCEVREIFDVPCNVGCGVFNTDNDVPSSPVAYLPFNANSLDESGVDKDGPYDNDATVFGATLTADRFGCADKAYELNGSSDYLTMAHSGSLEMSDVAKVSVAVWVKKASGQTTSAWIAILQKSDRSYNLQFKDGNEPTFTIHDTTSAISIPPGPGFHELQSNMTLSNDVWYHLVGTFDGTSMKLYVDGILKNQMNTTKVDTIRDASSFDVGIGENLDQTGRHMHGSVDDITVWDRALTDDEVLDYYNSTSHK